MFEMANFLYLCHLLCFLFMHPVTGRGIIGLRGIISLHYVIGIEFYIKLVSKIRLYIIFRKLSLDCNTCLKLQ